MAERIECFPKRALLGACQSTWPNSIQNRLLERIAIRVFVPQLFANTSDCLIPGCDNFTGIWRKRNRLKAVTTRVNVFACQLTGKLNKGIEFAKDCIDGIRDAPARNAFIKHLCVDVKPLTHRLIQDSLSKLFACLRLPGTTSLEGKLIQNRIGKAVNRQDLRIVVLGHRLTQPCQANCPVGAFRFFFKSSDALA